MIKLICIGSDIVLKMKDIIDEKDKRLRTISKEVEFPLSDEDKKHIQDMLEYLKNSQIEELSEKEIYWINFYNSYENGYNSTGGGDGRKIFSSTQIEQIIKLYQSGYCIRDICTILNSSIETVSFYVKQKLKLTDEEIKNNGYKIRGKKQNKPVVQLSLNGIEINTFSSMTEAQEKTGIWKNHIGDVCNGKRQTAGGFKWKFL